MKPARSSSHPERSPARALSDAALVDAMRASVPSAWEEFDDRFRPLLERYATRVGIPRWEWSVCIIEVLDDEAMRLIERSREMPQHLSAYLVRAVRNRHLALKRAASRRERRDANAAAADGPAYGVGGLAISEHSRRACDPPRLYEERAGEATPLVRFAALLTAQLTTDERQMLGWVAEGIPQRVIAEWSGITREAAKKRIARLCRRLRALATELSSAMPAEARREIDRLIARASIQRQTSHSGESDDG